MKTSLLSFASALVLLCSASNLAVAAPVAAKASLASHDDDKRRNNYDKRNDNDRHLSPAEKARLEALRRKNDRRDDRYDNNRRDEQRDKDRRDDQDYRQGKDFNYGYSNNHRVTPSEKARWEAQHRNGRR